MLADYHIHTEFSDDSTEKMEHQVQHAIQIGLDEICFTDHVDYGIKLDWNDPRGITYRENHEPLANVDYPKYFEKIRVLKKANQSEISIKSGLEFGIQTHTIPQYEQLYKKYHEQLDFVLLSMHQVNDLEFWTGDFMKGRSQKEYNELYYEEIYEVQKQYKNYSVLAHLDLLSRYDSNGIYPFQNVEDIIAAILKQAIEDKKGIEVNTSSYHYGLKDTQPSRAILKLYKDLGGKIITVGSDAHSTKYLGDHIQDTYQILKEEIGFKEICTFESFIPKFYMI